MSYHATLVNGPDRFRVQGLTFERDQRVPVTQSLAEYLRDNPDFRIDAPRRPQPLTLDEAAFQGAHAVADSLDVPESTDRLGRPADKAARLAAIKEAGDGLDVDDGNFLSDGRPDARALTSVLGWLVTSDERDALWPKVRKEEVKKGKVTITRRAPVEDVEDDEGPSIGETMEAIEDATAEAADTPPDPSTEGAVDV